MTYAGDEPLEGAGTGGINRCSDRDPRRIGDVISQHSPGKTQHSWNYGITKEQNPQYRARMIKNGFYVMHFRYAYNGWFS